METKRKFFIQMSGAPGSGKSTLANLLAQHRVINGVVINHDLIKSFFLEKGNNFHESAVLAYGLQWTLAEDLLKQGRSVLIDSCCNYTEALDKGTALAQQYDFQYTYLECRLSTSDIGLLEKRLHNRVALRSQRKSVNHEPIDINGTNGTNGTHGTPEDPLARYKNWIESPVRPSSASIHAIAVDSTKSPAECLADALQQMGLSTESLSNGVHSAVDSTAMVPALSGGSPNIIDIESKFRGYLAVPIIEDDSLESASSGISISSVLVQLKDLLDQHISIDQVNKQVLSRRSWNQGDLVIGDLVVKTKFGGTLLVLSRSSEQQSSEHTDEPIYLAESGSSANVALVLGSEGEPEVHKTCSHLGIDGNGSPWLRRQAQFYESSAAVQQTGLFVKPLRHGSKDGTASVAFPYVSSHSLAEMAMSGMGAQPLLSVVVDLLGDMAISVFPKATMSAPDDFVKMAHFDRMRRRIAIARVQVPELDFAANCEHVTVNGRRLLGFERVLEALESHPTINMVGPKEIGDIHGDLNLHNILCQLDPHADRPVVLIDPRGMPLLHDFAASMDAEPGDYAYDLSKMKFSLSAFSEIRKGFYKLRGGGDSFELQLLEHPGSATLRGADDGFFASISSSAPLLKWVDTVERCGLLSMELRVLIGEAAHYVADSACALGRAKGTEVVPLFLIGLLKLNDLLERVQGKAEQVIDRSIEATTGLASPNIGASTIQSVLLGSSDGQQQPWDLMEVLVKPESTHACFELLSQLVGECLPEGTGVYLCTDAVEHVKFPCVLIHPFVGSRGQTSAVLSGISRTEAFLRDRGVAQDRIDSLRTVTISSTGACNGSQSISRQNDSLLAPGPWGLSPLRLAILQANQLTFTNVGRWIVASDTFFVLSQALNLGGDCLGLMTSRSSTVSPNSAPRICVESTQKIDGRTFAGGFRDIQSQEGESNTLKAANGIFMPNSLGQRLTEFADDYAARTSDLFLDLVLPRFMEKDAWIRLCHDRGCDVNSDVAWTNAKYAAGVSPFVELVHGGDDMAVHHFGTESEYSRFVDEFVSDPLITSLIQLPSTAKWLRRYPRFAKTY